jgi:single stranded DNA-binding protein
MAFMTQKRFILKRNLTYRLFFFKFNPVLCEFYVLKALSRRFSANDSSFYTSRTLLEDAIRQPNSVSNRIFLTDFNRRKVMGRNIVKIKGNLGAEPEFRKTQDGKDVVCLRIATSGRYFDSKSNQWKDAGTQWFNAVAFKSSEVLEAKNLRKGSLVNIEGRLKSGKYVDDSGIERISTEIVIHSLEEIVRRSSVPNNVADREESMKH